MFHSSFHESTAFTRLSTVAFVVAIALRTLFSIELLMLVCGKLLALSLSHAELAPMARVARNKSITTRRQTSKSTFGHPPPRLHDMPANSENTTLHFKPKRRKKVRTSLDRKRRAPTHVRRTRGREHSVRCVRQQNHDPLSVSRDTSSNTSSREKPALRYQALGHFTQCACGQRRITFFARENKRRNPTDNIRRSAPAHLDLAG